MSDAIECISPVNGEVFASRQFHTAAQIEDAVSRAKRAQVEWRQVPLAERAEICRKAIGVLLADKDRHGYEITMQMGRPISQSSREIEGFANRTGFMIDIANEALADELPRPGSRSFIRREPLGVVLSIAAWNYPYLIPAGSCIPAIMAGNAVLLKHSGQTPLVSERLVEAYLAAGLPEGVFQFLHLDHDLTARLIADERIGHVGFTGSVEGGRAIHAAAARRFINVGLELGGKDPAYVCPDADMETTIERLVDGSFYNAGQSCCSTERIYVHRDIYDDFIARFVELTRQYRLGDPTDPATNLGPMVRGRAADFVRGQIARAVSQGARALIDERAFPASRKGSAYLAPQVMVDVDHTMEIMKEETFGPVVGIMKVDSDDAAIRLMNDSIYGLSASIWTRDADKVVRLGERIETGTVMMNGTDKVDPALAWSGVKDTGCGCTLSRHGYEHLTRTKSFDMSS
ncbi:aldehyde dehydrogenase family protein [Rhodobacteraceae bacterium HSP-20]|uniref:Aldehyde dehydrogenase family protein n=1 Tax=Paragemmobacter amnigenus TaxID=2852097 RepID=A0ABS6JA53_9RHOB|nr:aldehyde dehydrogenase family protein [Rhodobacter amnigenus]MBU9700111.1 aldehyde dehydrogenase family protein [Rhodobacter amnigenus]MBV4391338.1 aldehyde dehydrogenase family protein [Rhodobacter amnigenus]